MDISVSDILSFKRCPRKWDLTSYNRQALVPVGQEAKHFYIGTAIHRALEAQARGHDPNAALQGYWSEVEQKGETDEADWNMVCEVLHHYFARYGWHQPLKPYEYVAVELSFRCAIPDARDGFLIGTFDGIVTDGARVWIVDHKTYQRTPDLEVQEYNEQFIAYQWAFYQVFGHLPNGVIYDGIRKKAPKVPAVLKSGKGLSRDLRGTAYHAYLDAIHANGFSVDDYKDELYELSVRDSLEQNDFFTRWFIKTNPRMLEVFEQQLPFVYNTMLGTGTDATKPLYAYPVFNNYDGCFDCPVRPICYAMQRGENVEYVTRTAFTRGKPYGTVQAQASEPISVEQLKRSLYGPRHRG